VFRRSFDLRAALKSKSLLLLGPRQTGKSTFLRTLLPDATYVDLLDSRTYRQLTATPEVISDLVRSARTPHVIIDEVQRVPELTNEVQRLLQREPSRRFVLTGSSARKLRKSGTNLLGGRMSRQLFCPLTLQEASTHEERAYAVADLVAWGGLPHVLLADDPAQELEDYVGTYLKEEIQAEAHVRNLGQFTRFLNVAALSVGQQTLFSNVANDCQVPATTVRDYFQLLEDTLVGHMLPAYQATKKRKAYASSKFYFFDVGVANALRGAAGTARGDATYGVAFEHLVFCELKAWQAYRAPYAELHYWRSLSNYEVDFVVALPRGRVLGLEVKATTQVNQADCRGLLALREDIPNLTMAVVCEERHARQTEQGIQVIPVEQLGAWLSTYVATPPRRAGTVRRGR
jgi:uncharacterized protein